MLLDIGIGAAASESIIVPDWNIGAASTASIGPKSQYWPLFIPSGTRIAARTAGVILNDTCAFSMMLDQEFPFGPPSTLDRVTSYGVTAVGSKGINVITGANAYGSWTQLTAATSSDHDAWAVSLGQAADVTVTGGAIFVQLGVGPTAGPQVIGEWIFATNVNEEISGPIPDKPTWQPVPSGTAICARVAAAATTETFDVIAHGLG
ncbi:MAG: hypothetical protein H0U16_07105 [Actinobacteria bacterium]|nr:hypothetical protein [Actinomycetota bacterium]